MKRGFSFIQYCVKGKECVRIAFLYVGAFVGAGFASGSEIQLYFGNANLLTLLLSALLTGGFCTLFLCLGSLRVRVCGALHFALDTLFAVSGVIVAGVMLSSLTELTGTPYAAVGLALLCAISLLFGEKGVKTFCSLAVPLIAFSLFLVAIRAKGSVTGSFQGGQAVKYAAMNVFFEFGLMLREGKNISLKWCLLTGICVVVITFLLLLPMRSVIGDVQQTLPFVSRSASLGFGWLSVITMFAAVGSTVAGCFSLGTEPLRKLFPQSVCTLMVATVALSIAAGDFTRLIGKVYPVFSAFGIVLSCISFSVFFAVILGKKRNCKCKFSFLSIFNGRKAGLEGKKQKNGY